MHFAGQFVRFYPKRCQFQDWDDWDEIMALLRVYDLKELAMKLCCVCPKNGGLFAVGLVATGVFVQSMSQGNPPAVEEEKAKPASRFDEVVRESFFEGFQGNEAALEKGIKVCEEILSKQPKHAEAMVWLGGGQVFKSGQYFQKGMVADGMKNWQEGIKNMDKAAELEPDNIGVLIPRAAVLLPASRGLPMAIKKPVLEGVLKNFEHVYEMQKNDLQKIGEHPLGELRMGMADTYRMLGNSEKSKEHLESVIKELPETEYATEAKKWLESKPTDRLSHNCIGCHTK